MSSILTSNLLIKSIKRRAFIPKDQATFTNEDFLEMATEEITIGLMEQIIEARGNYLVYYIDVPLVADQVAYSIPSRAHGSKLREAYIAAADKPEEIIYDLTQIDVEDLSDISSYYSAYNSQTHFYLRNDKVILCPSVIKDSYVIRMFFYMRPNKLVTNDRAAVVASIADSTEIIDTVDTPVKIFSFSTLPKHFVSGMLVDITSHISPNKILDFSISPVSINLTLKTITIVASDLTETISVGDYVTSAEETIVPNLPTEYHPIVAQRTARACLEAMNDDSGYAKASSKLAEMEKAVLKIVTNRVEGSPKKIRQRNGTLSNGINKSNRGW